SVVRPGFGNVSRLRWQATPLPIARCGDVFEPCSPALRESLRSLTTHGPNNSQLGGLVLFYWGLDGQQNQENSPSATRVIRRVYFVNVFATLRERRTYVIQIVALIAPTTVCPTCRGSMMKKSLNGRWRAAEKNDATQRRSTSGISTAQIICTMK